MLIKIVDGKTNFIDQNDNFVGYSDQYTCCCEHPYWEFEDENGTPLGEDTDPGGNLIFTGETIKDKYHSVSFPCTNGYTLKLYNIQNGYYSHMWESRFDGETDSGSI